MIKSKKLVAINILLIIVLLTAMVTMFVNTKAFADTNDDDVEEEISPRGVMCRISISISGKDATMTAKAKNEFTLGSSTIRVIVELYSADFYAEDSSQMTLVASNQISDLNIYKSISVSEYTYNEQKFWCARVRYKFDNEDWVAKETKVHLYDANANLLV